MTIVELSSDGKKRCAWCLSSPQYIHYHDFEWGFPVKDDQKLFEKISLEIFQSGLSWRTILSKRDNFRAAFAQFDFSKVALFTEQDVLKLLGEIGIVRHRGKIEAVIHNAAHAQEMVRQKGSLAAFFWKFSPKKDGDGITSLSQTAESQAMASALKQRGWKFVGPTTCYAFMQAVGMVNDHGVGCVMRPVIAQARRSFVRPH